MGADESMLNPDAQALLQHWVKEVSREGDTVVVEVGCFRGGTTIRLAEAVRDSGGGIVYAVDPHRDFTGVYGGQFSRADHEAFERNISDSGVQSTVHHLCMDSQAASAGWTQTIDCLFIDGDHSYQGVSTDMAQWIRHVRPGGIVAFDDIVPGSEAEAALIECMDWPLFRFIGENEALRLYRKLEKPRTLYLCAGMQSGGTTLVSWCFLQRQDMDGVYDMENARLHEDFIRLATDKVWLKMTVGAFRLSEAVQHYTDLGWDVRPMLVGRNPYQVFGSLKRKSYGFNGLSGDEPPLTLRLSRFLADWVWCGEQDIPRLVLESFLSEPELQLRSLLDELELDWDPAMLQWPKAEADIAFPAMGSATFNDSRERAGGLLAAIAHHGVTAKRIQLTTAERDWVSTNMRSLLESNDYTDEAVDIEEQVPSACAHPRYRGTQRQRLEQLEIEYGKIAPALDWYEREAGQPRLLALLFQLPYPRRMLRFLRYWRDSRQDRTHDAG